MTILTKEMAITYHRKMWHWIADKFKENKYDVHGKPGNPTIIMKKMYCIENPDHISKDLIEYVSKNNRCFLCAYSHIDCLKCPLQWTDNEDRNETRCYCLDHDSPYKKCITNYSNNKRYLYALEIANLKSI